jgi:hypothetical protein
MTSLGCFQSHNHTTGLYGYDLWLCVSMSLHGQDHRAGQPANGVGWGGESRLTNSLKSTISRSSSLIAPGTADLTGRNIHCSRALWRQTVY